MYDSNHRTHSRPPEYILDIEDILNKKQEDYLDFIEKAKNFAKESRENANQIRNFYDGMIIPLKEKSEDSDMNKQMEILAKLKIMLAYARGRKNVKDVFYKNMDGFCNALMKNCTTERIKRFVEFMEAFVAYNKMEGSK